MFVSSCQSVDMTIDIVKHEVRFHVVTSTLPLPRCRFHVFASTLPLPRCRFRVVASTLSLPSCRKRERERHGSHVHIANVLARAFFSYYYKSVTRSLVQPWCGVGLDATGTSSLSALDPLSGQEKRRRLAGGRFGFIAYILRSLQSIIRFGTERHTHGIWSTFYRLVFTWLTERTYVRTRLLIVRVG